MNLTPPLGRPARPREPTGTRFSLAPPATQRMAPFMVTPPRLLLVMGFAGALVSSAAETALESAATCRSSDGASCDFGMSLLQKDVKVLRQINEHLIHPAHGSMELGLGCV